MEKDEFKNLTALIIEDEKMMRQILRGLLREIGFTNIVDAEDGAAALALIAHHPEIDIVICDLEMPVMGGLKFVRMLRSSRNKDCRDIPVLIATGHSQKEIVYEAVHLGVHGFLVKPISFAKLKSHIVRAINQPPINPANLN
ncbi:MAG: response regulator [Rhodospirillales bacterium]|nr:response regulator [Rhodospirillales bacterium]